MVDIRSKVLAALPLSTAGGAVRKAAEGALDMRSILVEGDLIAVRCVMVWMDGWPHCCLPRGCAALLARLLLPTYLPAAPAR